MKDYQKGNGINGFYPVTIGDVAKFEIEKFVSRYALPFTGLKSRQSESSLRHNVSDGIEVLDALQSLEGTSGSEEYQSKFRKIRSVFLQLVIYQSIIGDSIDGRVSDGNGASKKAEKANGWNPKEFRRPFYPD